MTEFCPKHLRETHSMLIGYTCHWTTCSYAIKQEINPPLVWNRRDGSNGLRMKLTNANDSMSLCLVCNPGGGGGEIFLVFRAKSDQISIILCMFGDNPSLYFMPINLFDLILIWFDLLNLMEYVDKIWHSQGDWKYHFPLVEALPKSILWKSENCP